MMILLLYVFNQVQLQLIILDYLVIFIRVEVRIVSNVFK